MNQKLDMDERKTFRRLIILLGASMLVFSLCSRIFFRLNGVDSKYRISQDDRLSGYVLRSSGAKDTFTGNAFPAVRNGDSLTVEIKEPGHNPYSQGTNICFFATNSVVTAWCGEELIYEQDQTEISQGIMPCHQFYTILLPEDYEEAGITVNITPVDRSSFTSINMWLSPSGHATKNIIVGKEFSFCLLITMAMIAAFVTAILTVLSITRRQFNPTILLALFCLLIVLWNFGSQGFLYLISDSLLASQGEYITLYLSCVPFCFFLANHVKDKICETILYGLALFFTVFFIYATFLNFSSLPVSYNTVLMWLHGAIFLMMFTYFVSLWRDRNEKLTFVEKITEHGIRICLFIGLLEFVRFNIVNNFGTPVSFLRNSFGPLAIAALVLTMLLSAGFSYAHDYLEKMEKEHLRILAYQDNLTGIPNRSACYLGLDSLVDERTSTYSIFFLDLNYLKKANDSYGHEVGDKMLILTAQAMKKAFEGNGFYGRWGGDEFIACVPGDPSKGDAAIKVFREEVERINREETDLPYGLSIAIGRTDSSERKPLAPIDAVNYADETMYEDKKRMKAERVD